MKHLHSVLKLIESNGVGENEILDNLENLKNTIDSFEDMLEDTEFNQDPDRNLQLHDFVNKLKMIKGKYRIHILIKTLEIILLNILEIIERINLIILI